MFPEYAVVLQWSVTQGSSRARHSVFDGLGVYPAPPHEHTYVPFPWSAHVFAASTLDRHSLRVQRFRGGTQLSMLSTLWLHPAPPHAHVQVPSFPSSQTLPEFSELLHSLVRQTAAGGTHMLSFATADQAFPRQAQL
jgi:hypothetical protein